MTTLTKLGVNVAAFADSNPNLWGEDIDGIKILSPEELKNNYPINPILIASLTYETEIYETLREMSFSLVYPLSFLNYKRPDIFISPEYFQKFSSLFKPKNQTDILKIYELWEDEYSRKVFYNLIKFRLTLDKSCIKKIKSKPEEQYFEPSILNFSQKEIFADCGAYTGDTVIGFYKKVSGNFRKVYAFEPDPVNFSLLNGTIRNFDSLRIISINKGVHREAGKMGFCGLGRIDARISGEESSVSLPVIGLDSFFTDKEPPTFIKMDIEGAETEAFLGAKKIIQKNKPKLAISVYHKSQDLWKIPLLIKSLNKDYRLYLRHYTNEIVDTVCYAV